MKRLIIGVLACISLHLNAQIMNTPNDVVTQLFVSTDQHNWDTLKETFNTSVLLDYSSMTGNAATELTPDQIISSWKGVLPGFEFTHHQIGNVLTTIDGNTAKVFCYGTATHYLKHDNGNIWTVVGSYNFDLIKVSGQWKISSMTFNFKYQDGNTALVQSAIEALK